jgi:hypothetical protein
MMNGGRERRRDARSQTGFPLVVEDPGSASVDYIENISCGGALCHAVRDVPMMTKVPLVFDLPGDRPRRISCEGVVVRREEHGEDLKVGVVFTNVTADNRDAIARFVSGDLA